MAIASVKIVPQVEDLEPVEPWTPTEEEQKRSRRIHARIDLMLQERAKHEDAMERSLLLYSGKSRDLKDPRKEKVVVPFARIFVEAKTSEEVKAMNPYDFEAGKDPSDEWKLELVKDTDKHVRRRVKMGPKKIQAIRMKNICGVSIVRVGYRKIMRVIRDRKFGQEDGDTLEYMTREVPVYDDLFLDLVSPFNFAIDPNATTMDDAMDCVHFHTENWEVFMEAVKHFPGIKNLESVRPGKDGRVDVAEYFNKIGPDGDEWVMVVAPSGTSHGRKWSTANLPRVEIYEGPLPDDHKELPFVSYHNNPNFLSAFVKDRHPQSGDGTEGVVPEEIRADEGFWTEGDPVTMMDLIDLRTAFGRQAYKALKRASSYIVATAPGAVFDDSRPWRDGDQAVGMKEKFSVESLGEANIASFQFAFDDLFNLKIMLSGVDPRNLSDNKTKTATEAAIQRETMMRRLEQGLEYNEENGEVRLGTLLYQLVQQRYSKPELVALNGLEDEKQLKEFDEVENDPDTGKPMMGKRYRVIPSSHRMKETRRKKRDGSGYKYYLTKTEEGGKSFLSRPEYIRSSDIRVIISSGRRAGEIRAIAAEQAGQWIDRALAAYQFTLPGKSGEEPLLTADDLPNVKQAFIDLAKALGKNPDQAIGRHGGKEVDPEEEKDAQAAKAYSPVQINPPIAGPEEQMDPGMANTPIV